MSEGGGRGERPEQSMEPSSTVSLRQKLTNELRSVAAAALYFAAWIGILVTLKQLILAEYSIEFRGLSMALVGAARDC